jgi:drug/metabolite transporter (DMT)-like permease
VQAAAESGQTGGTVFNKSSIFTLFVVLQTAIYGVGNVVTKIAYVGISPLWCAALRFGLAFLVFMLFFGPRTVRMLKSARLSSWLPSSVFMSLTYITCSIAINLTSATNAGFFIALPMLFTPVLALVLSGSKYTASTAVLQAVVVFGLYLLCCNGGTPTFGLGELFGLASSACFAASLVFGERGLDDVDPIALSTMQIGITFLGALASAIASEPLPDFAAVPAVSWTAIAFLACVGTCLAFFLQNTALKHVPSATISVILCAEPVFTAAVSAVALGEMLTGMGVVGAILIVACTMVASLADSGKSTGEILGDAFAFVRRLAPNQARRLVRSR